MMVRQEGYGEKVWPMIIHRDIKPENIFFSKVHPVLGSHVERRKILKVFSIPRTEYTFSPQYPKVVLGDFVSPEPY